MKFKKRGGATVGWWLVLILPVLNLYGMWRVAKLIANIESERGD